MILISACLCGCNCKYNGKNNINEQCIEILKSGKAMIVCPEQLGGLTTPRTPAEIIRTCEEIKIIDKNGIDVTENFIRGAAETLKLAKIAKVTDAILKEGSPSCGSNYIYDGTFKGVKIEGEGITSKLLKENGINVWNEESIPVNFL